MVKKIRLLEEHEIDKICDKQVDCTTCPLFTFIDIDNTVGVCAAEYSIIGPVGLMNIAKVLESEVEVEEIES